VIAGVLLVRVNVADTESPSGWPVAATVYVPDEIAATVNVAVSTPFEIEQADVAKYGE
jgi:hypothetical protein